MDSAPKNTREQILEAAREALTQNGYENITTRRIAEAAGVNIAALHYYFGSKEALLAESVQHALNEAVTRLRAAAFEAQAIDTSLTAMFQTAWEIVKEKRGILRYDLAVRGLRDATANHAARALYAAFVQLNEEVLQKYIEEDGRLVPGISVLELARYIVAATDGVFLQHALNGDDVAAQSSLRLLQQHILSLLQAGAGTQRTDD